MTSIAVVPHPKALLTPEFTRLPNRRRSFARRNIKIKSTGSRIPLRSYTTIEIRKKGTLGNKATKAPNAMSAVYSP